MTYFTYEVPPIDFGWEHLKTINETVVNFAARIASTVRKNDIDTIDLTDFLDRWSRAKDAASEKGWEGDFRHEPCVFWVPADTEFDYGFVFKQDNNGNTYVVSPVEMPWLESDL